MVFACKVSTNLDQVIALEVVLPNGGQVEVGDTLLPSARALNGHGDTITTDIFWVTLDTTIITVLDSTTGATLGDLIGQGRLEARAGLLTSNPQTVTVITHLDSVLPAAPVLTRDTIILSQADTISDSLRVQLFASPALAVGRRVAFSATTFPASDPLVTLVPRDTIFSSGTAGKSRWALPMRRDRCGDPRAARFRTLWSSARPCSDLTGRQYRAAR